MEIKAWGHQDGWQQVPTVRMSPSKEGNGMRVDHTHCLREDGGRRTEQEDWENGSRMRAREPRKSGHSGAIMPDSWVFVSLKWANIFK